MEVSTTDDLSPLSDASITNMIENLQEEGVLECHLPGGGYIHLSEELPYLVVYRQEEDRNDQITVKFVLSEASF